MTILVPGSRKSFQTKGSILKFHQIYLFIYLFNNSISHLDFSHGKFGLLSLGKASCDRVAFPNYSACQVFQCFCDPPNSDEKNRIFNVRTDVNACDCTLGCTDTVRESALKVDSGRKFPCRTGESNLPQRCASPTLYHLSYIPTPVIRAVVLGPGCGSPPGLVPVYQSVPGTLRVKTPFFQREAFLLVPDTLSEGDDCVYRASDEDEVLLLTACTFSSQNQYTEEETASLLQQFFKKILNKNQYSVTCH